MDLMDQMDLMDEDDGRWTMDPMDLMDEDDGSYGPYGRGRWILWILWTMGRLTADDFGCGRQPTPSLFVFFRG